MFKFTATRLASDTDTTGWTGVVAVQASPELASNYFSSPRFHVEREEVAVPAGITEASAEVFFAYACDAPNWSGSPLVGGNVGGSKAERGNLTQLKRAGLITTFTDEGETWIEFTEKGEALAHQYGVRLGKWGEVL